MFFFIFFKNNVDIYYSRIVAATLFLPFTMPKNFSWVVLVFFAILTLVSQRLLGLLSTRYVSKGGASRFFLFRVLILFFFRFVPLETLSVNLSDT